MIKPWIDAMSVQPSGGHAVFPINAPPPGEEKQDRAEVRVPKPASDFEKAMSSTWEEPEVEKIQSPDMIVFNEVMVNVLSFD